MLLTYLFNRFKIIEITFLKENGYIYYDDKDYYFFHLNSNHLVTVI